MGFEIGPFAVRRSIWIDAPPENVWQEFESFERMADWYGTGHALVKYEPGVGGCFRVTKVSANCYELYDYSSEFGRADAPPLQKGAWNGRMWRTQAPHTIPQPCSRRLWRLCFSRKYTWSCVRSSGVTSWRG